MTTLRQNGAKPECGIETRARIGMTRPLGVAVRMALSPNAGLKHAHGRLRIAR